MPVQSGILSPGTYDNWNASLQLGSMGVDDYLVAEHRGTVTISPHRGWSGTTSAISPTKRCVIRGIRFVGFDWAINLANEREDIDELVIEDCEFVNCDIAINGWQDEQMLERGPAIGYLTIRKCKIIGAKYSGIRVCNRFKGVLIEDCEFYDCHGPNILVGNNFEKWQNEWKDAIIRYNTLVRVHAPSDSIGIQAYGVGHLIEYNTIMFDQFTEVKHKPNGDLIGTAEGIYCKMMHGCIRHNLLLNAGGYEGQICLKGASWSESGVKGGFNRVYGNEIHRTGRVPHRPHDRAVMVRSDKDTHVFENTHSGNSSILIKSAATAGGSEQKNNDSY